MQYEILTGAMADDVSRFSGVKVLFVSNLFPDAREPARGSVNSRLLHSLSRHCEIRVQSPRPALPVLGVIKGGGPRSSMAADACFEPAYPAAYYVPKMGSRFNHLLMTAALRPEMQRVRRQFPFDVILGSWIYPDGCAVARLAAELDVPFVLVAQGSDVHEYLLIPARRRIIAEHLKGAAAVIARSKELSRLLESAPVDEKKLRVIYNGVDFDVFHPADKAAARQELGLPPAASVVLFVGGFFPVKNPGLAVASHALLSQQMPGRKVVLVMLGTGPLWRQIRRETEAAGGTVLMAGQKTSAQVARYMQAADVLCVSSDNEGVPNVIYEAFACGLKVVATNVGGISEVLGHEFLGGLAARGDSSAMAAALKRALEDKEDRARISDYARQFSWEKTAGDYFDVLEQAVRCHAGKSAAGG